MKVIATINNIRIEKNIPTQWSEMNFKSYLEVGHLEDLGKVIAYYFGASESTLKKAKITNLDTVLSVLAFIKKPMNMELPDKILQYKIPKNLEAETTGQYEDVNLICSTFRDNDTVENVIFNISKYPDMITIFAMPDYHESTDEAKAEFSKQFFLAPCEEVLAIGNFTIKKLIESNLNIPIPSPSQPILLRKCRLVWTGFRKRMAFTVRYWLWNAKFRSIGKSF